MKEIKNMIHISTREEWRQWLEKNHKKEAKVFLVSYKKHTGKPSITHRESLEEAICFGWIDTTIKRLDDERYGRYFVRRTDSSRWSENTLKYAKELIREKRMAPEGLRRYKEGLKKPTHDHGIPKNPSPPPELERALAENKKAEENFKNLAPSYKKTYLRWLLGAKRAETREKRITRIVTLMEQNKKLEF